MLTTFSDTLSFTSLKLKCISLICLQNDTNYYDMEMVFECLKCPDGCDTCEDDRPCVVSLNWLMRSAILILQCSIILMLPIVGLFTFKYSEVKVKTNLIRYITKFEKTYEWRFNNRRNFECNSRFESYSAIER